MPSHAFLHHVCLLLRQSIRWPGVFTGSGINKPVAVRDWLNKTQPKEDYILVIDSDTIMRVPFNMDELHLEPGQLRILHCKRKIASFKWSCCTVSEKARTDHKDD